MATKLPNACMQKLNKFKLVWPASYDNKFETGQTKPPPKNNSLLHMIHDVYGTPVNYRIIEKTTI